MATLLKRSLNESRKYLTLEGVLTESDSELYPINTAKDVTVRDLTILLIKQHDFLVNRVLTLTTIGQKRSTPHELRDEIKAEEQLIRNE